MRFYFLCYIYNSEILAEMFLKLCQIYFGKNCLWLIFHSLWYLNWFQDLFFRLFKTGFLKGGMYWLSRLGTFAKSLLFFGNVYFWYINSAWRRVLIGVLNNRGLQIFLECKKNNLCMYFIDFRRSITASANILVTR